MTVSGTHFHGSHSRSGEAMMTTIIARYRAITDEQVCVVIGKTWAEWITLLDTWDASKKSLVSITNHLIEHYGLTQLWAQAVAVDYRWEHAPEMLERGSRPRAVQ